MVQDPQENAWGMIKSPSQYCDAFWILKIQIDLTKVILVHDASTNLPQIIVGISDAPIWLTKSSQKRKLVTDSYHDAHATAKCCDAGTLATSVLPLVNSYCRPA